MDSFYKKKKNGEPTRLHEVRNSILLHRGANDPIHQQRQSA